MAELLGYQFDRVYNKPIERYRQVATISERDAIPSGKRWEGMLCYVLTEGVDYQLINGINNADWTSYVASSSVEFIEVYSDLTELTTSQSNQTTSRLYEVTDATGFTDITTGTAWVRYLGTITETEADYIIVSKQESSGGGGSDTAAEILAKLLTVDGTGSGLDADLLRGVHWGNVNTDINSSANISVTGDKEFRSSRDFTWEDANVVGVKLGTSSVAGILDFRRWLGGGNLHQVASITQKKIGDDYGLAFNVDDLSTNTEATSTRMFIDVNGNIGIGTTEPTEKLEVEGTVKVSGDVIVSPEAYGATWNNSNEVPTKNAVYDKIETIVSGSSDYLEYEGIMSQTGTSAPTVILIKNTLGSSIVWTRSSTGIYVGSITGGFPSSSTLVFVTNGYQAGWVNGVCSVPGGEIVLNSFSSTGARTDGILERASIHIKVKI